MTYINFESGSLVSIAGAVDVSDRANRILGIVYGNLAQLQQRSVTFELLVQLANAGIQIDPRQIRLLTNADIISSELTKVGGTAQTGRDWSLDFAKLQNLDTALSSIKTGTDNLIAGTTIYNDQTSVTTAGTRVVLGASTTVKWVIVKAKATNTGNIFVGNATVTSTNGYILVPGEAIGLDINNLNLVYIDSAVNLEGVSYIARN